MPSSPWQAAGYSAKAFIKVLYTSGYAEEVIALHGVLETGLDFIPKPYSPRVIAHAVREVLDRKPRTKPPA